jgi:hypothetical protein
MKTKWHTFGMVLCLLVAPGLWGCSFPGFVSGGGTIPSADGVPGDKANFGFSAKQCDTSQPPTGNLNYNDKAKGVAFNGDITDAERCESCDLSSIIACMECTTDACRTACANTLNSLCARCVEISLRFSTPAQSSGELFGATFNFRSTNLSSQDSGTGIVCARDNGDGNDWAAVQLTSTGPFNNYQNSGIVQGNISGKTCQ